MKLIIRLTGFLLMMLVGAVTIARTPSVNSCFVNCSEARKGHVAFTTSSKNITLLERSILIHGLELKLINANKPTISFHRPSITKITSFHGSNPAIWNQSESGYHQVRYDEVYRSIDLIFTIFKNEQLEFQWIVNPGGKAADIQMEIVGDNFHAKTSEDAVVIFDSDIQVVEVSSLSAYQGSNEVTVKFDLKDNIITYAIDEYNKDYTLIIDPILSDLRASSYLGGEWDDVPWDIAIDPNGYVFVVGRTPSTDFPVNNSAYDTSFSGGSRDAFICKMTNDLSTIVAATYFGGGDYDKILALDFDVSGNVYVTGETRSTDFPITNNVFDNLYNGVGDGFIAVFSNDLSSLIASTYFGGIDNEESWAIKLDNAGSIYVAGFTESNDYPVTPSAYDVSYNGNNDVFISKFSNDLSTLQSSTYFGGSDWDEFRADIAFNSVGDVYITGWSNSLDFPVTNGAYDTLRHGNFDVFVSKFDNNLVDLLATTNISRNGDGVGKTRGLIIDSKDNVWVAGHGWSGFNVMPSAYDTSYGGNQDLIIAKLDQNLSSLLASTFLGGSSNEQGFGIALNSDNQLVIAGYSYSPDYPMTSSGFDTVHTGADSDGVISVLENDLTQLVTSTFLGGTGTDDHIYAIEVYNGELFVTGLTNSDDFPVIGGSNDSSYNGGQYDCFISKFGPDSLSIEVKENILDQRNNYEVHHESLEFKLITPAYIGFDVYDIQGRLLSQKSIGYSLPGTYTYSIFDDNRKTYLNQVVLLQIRMAKEKFSEKLLLK